MGLSSNQIPQANNPEKVLRLARHYAVAGGAGTPDGFSDVRDIQYCRSALKALGLLDQAGHPTALLSEFPTSGAEARAAFARAFAASPVGAAWLGWTGAETITELEADRAESFLEACSTLAPETRGRRASTLRQWLAWMRGSEVAAPVKSRNQVGLFDRPQTPDVPRAWPDPSRFPHNEDGARVDRVVGADLSDPGDVLVIAGYASLDRVIRFLAQRDYGPGGQVRILFGNEPFASKRDTWRLGGDRLADEVRDYWLERGISVLRSGDIVRVKQAMDVSDIQIRAARRERAVHAKVYVSPQALTLGSSNYTDNGLTGQSEANARFMASTPAYDEARQLAEGIWDGGMDYRDEFLKLLDALLKAVTWQEALARACAAILEGEWARRYIPPEELDNLARGPLWPHQLQGISQAVWTLHNVGSVLIADATGSGKTRMGAWLLRAAYDRQLRMGNGRRVEPVMIAPPPIVESWHHSLDEAGLRWRVDSHGPLSNVAASGHQSLIDAIAETELLALDEAHNYLNPSQRTKRILSHYADNAVLFTATPINRGATDLLALIELLGADNFPDEALTSLERLMKLRRNGGTGDEGDRDALRGQVRQFMVRRTRTELNRIAEARPNEYWLKSGRSARYPHHRAQFYDVDTSPEDIGRATEIVRLAEQLSGVARLGRRLELPRSLAIDGMTEEEYLRRVVRSVAALAQHFVLDCLRSSRAALYEHIHGTEAAIRDLALGLSADSKEPTGDTLGTLTGLAGKPPEWGLADELRDSAPRWLWDPEDHQRQCEADRALYRAIGEAAKGMSDARESAKLRELHKLLDRRGLVIAYDSHVLSLKVFEARLKAHGLPVDLFSGEGGRQAKKIAMKQLGLDTAVNRLIALCTDAFSEGMNLQSASAVVHLDTPTVIRTAEQRAGRVDRMDSPHDEVEIWWPRDPPGFAPRRKDLLRERHEVVADLIGANLQMPEDDGAQSIKIEDLAIRADVARNEDPRSLYDAFRPVRELVESGGPVPPNVYALMRTSQADVVACISLVRAHSAWAFFAVGGIQRIAPRWVLLDGLEAPPVADLGRIAELLRERLAPETLDHPMDDRADPVIRAMVSRLRSTERVLLPMRRQRALLLADKVLKVWADRAFRDGDMIRVRLLKRIVAMLAPAPEFDEHADPRSVADAWLQVVRPVQRKFLAERRRSRRLWRIDDLYKPLCDEPVGTEAIARAFSRIPMLPPISDRIVSMIVGIPV